MKHKARLKGYAVIVACVIVYVSIVGFLMIPACLSTAIIFIYAGGLLMLCALAYRLGELSNK